MQIIFLDNKLKDIWNKFCFSHLEGWLWHTTWWIDFCMNCRFDVKTKNLSFLVYDCEKPVAIVPLILEEFIDGDSVIRELTFAGGCTPHFLIDSEIGLKQSQKLWQYIWDEIKELSVKNNIYRVWFRKNFQNDTYGDFMQRENQFVREGFLDTSLYTNILCLKAEDKEILSGMTKGHSYAVKKSLNCLECKISDAGSINKEDILKFRDDYYRIAGKVTRPSETFDNLYEFIKNDMGILLEAIYKENTIGYIYIVFYKKYAYYLMSCTDDNYKELNVSHFLQWNVIRFLKNRGIEYYELGEQYFAPNLIYQVTDKLRNISLFKRGFGGNMFFQYSGEYFFSSDYLNTMYMKRIENLTKVLEE
jgi:hypothetical protein